ncbi:long-chain fatty acid--CoA ligase [Sporosarcina sp. P13]|uniref:long-chain-fatty-acid--CoA ligase n=1 Tax=Sporosarcina sp. P13 TaxID=2048263 RepID=UPI000C16BE00|nr:long-chain fatty acid--CoA ligase [Sporosarcina sp. P13]PIC63620.1 long-chain fatty acid--CoA ligase [Sporosarcina sp. P13]
MEKVVNKPWLQWMTERPTSTESSRSIYNLLENTAATYPERTAIIFQDELITYSSLKKSVDKLAGKWRQSGLKKGDRIGLMMANHPLYIITYYAAHALGLLVVQVNPLYTTRELMRIIEDSHMQYMVFDKTASTTVQLVSKEYTFTQCFTIENEQEELVSIYSLIESGAEIQTVETINPDEDVAVIQYTGGTGGEMKGVMLTHSNLTSNVAQGFEMYGKEITEEEVILTATPLYHVYAMTSAMNLGIYIGAAILLIPTFDVRNVLENIQKYKPSFFPGVPKMYNALISYPDVHQYDLSCLKNCTCGSAPLPIEIIKRFKQLTGVVIAEGFGLSEASPTTHRNPPVGNPKIGSIGIPIRDTDCKIIDENGQALGCNLVGELLIKGPQIMKGYLNNASETKKVLQNGWLHTGDLALMDEDGYFFIVGRKKELIIIDGFNIYPQEIEEVLYEFPGIQEVAVIGVQKSNTEELVKAFIVPKEDTTLDMDAIIEYCYLKLTRYKVPKQFEIIGELPRNTVGKVLKRLLT